MPEDICTIMEDGISKACKSKLADYDISRVSNALVQFRDIAKILASDQKSFFSNLFRNENLSKFCYPCDMVELRTILTDETIYSQGSVAFFPVNFASHYFPSYSVLLLLNDIDTDIDLDSLKVSSNNTFSLKDKLLGILVNQGRGRGVLAEAYRIAQECEAEVRVEPINQVPGTSLPQACAASKKIVKEASDISYQVNIESLGIKNASVRASSAVEAVQKALNERWQQLYGSKVNRSEKFLVKHWMNSPLWDDIVRQASTVYNLKKMAEDLEPRLEIQVAPKEQAIFDVLRSVRDASGIPVEMRVAGGWVRDKLLGIPSDDIDIAISHMSGIEFAKVVEQHGMNDPNIGTARDVSLEKKKQEETKGQKKEEPEKPELLVGGIQINGWKIELVPMRVETYDANSRTPTIARTDNVQDDVKRRDLTINAMYYNIDTGEVEDYAGGKEDLKNPEGMVLRTPDESAKTFNEDPLRMLRALRFLARYQDKGARLHPDMISAFSDPGVRESFRRKVTPQRIGQELWGKIETKEDGQEHFKAGILGQDSSPKDALAIMFDTGLDQLIFEHPSTAELAPMNMDQRAKRHAHNLQEHTLQVVNNYAESASRRGLDPRRKANGLLSALTHDFGKRDLEKRTAHPDNPKDMDPSHPEYLYQYLGHQEGSAIISEAVGKHLGIPSPDRYYVNAMNAQHMYLHGLAEPKRDKEGKEITIKDRSIRKYIREMAKIVENQPGNATAFMEDVSELSYADVKATHTDPSVANADVAREQSIVQRVLQEAEVQEEKPIPTLLNGKDIMGMFPMLNPQMGFIPEINAKIAEWLDEDPNLTKEQVAKKIKEEKVDPAKPESLTIYEDIIRKYTPVLDYKEVQKMFKDPSTGKFPKGHPFQMGDFTKVHRSIIDQSGQPDFNPDVARQIALREKQRMIDEQAATEQQMKTQFNLRSFIKLSQNPLGQDSHGYEGFHSQEGGQEIREQHDRSKPQPAIQPFYAGQIVKMRRRGLSFEQVFGTVKQVSTDRIVVEWEGTSKPTIYPNDLALLGYKLQRVN